MRAVPTVLSRRESVGGVSLIFREPAAVEGGC